MPLDAGPDRCNLHTWRAEYGMLEGMVIDGLGVPDDGTTRVDRVGVLLGRISHGDEEAFGRLYDLLSPRVFGLILALVPDPAVGEDVLQETFLEVWRTAARFEPGAERGRAWVFAVAQRRAEEALRPGQTPNVAQPDDAGEPTPAATADGVGDAAPPLTMRSSLLARIARDPQLPPVEASVAAAALEQGEPLPAAIAAPPAPPAPRGGPSAARGAPMVEPAPTTTTIQAVTRRNWTRGIVAFAGALVVLAGLGFGVATINEALARPAAVAALDEIESAPDAASATVALSAEGDAESGSVTVHWSPSLDTAVLTASGLPDLGADQVFQAWWAQDGAFTPAGTFRADRDGVATVLVQGGLREGADLMVSIEGDGEIGAEPAGDPIVAVPVG